ncbi:MAG: TonB-dependent receptor, partial [Bacteroidaceae bacterium]|nr:TonB-dependent receptor [Bacteroidaceae bacterium]
MRIHRLRSITAIILISFISLSFISDHGNVSIEDRIIAFFYNQNQIPQEKLYLHLDKPYYAAGDKIWFKGYLLNGITHKDNTLSNFFYVELINEKDSVLIRKKIKRDQEKGFNNMIPIPAAIEPGNYYLRAYTNWMCNMDSNFFYYKNLYIRNSIATAIQSGITYENGEKQKEAVIQFVDEKENPFIET